MPNSSLLMGDMRRNLNPSPLPDRYTMTSTWMGLTTVTKEHDKVVLISDRGLAGSIQTWLGLSPFAVEPKRVSA